MMERELFVLLMDTLRSIDGASRRPPKGTYTSAHVLAVLFWASVHDRPISWAVRREHWPWHDRTRPLPSSATVSRRLRAPEIHALILRVIVALRVGGDGGRTLVLDGRGLRIAAHSADPDAGWGRAAGGLCKGYRLHEIVDLHGNCRAFRVTSMRIGEQTVARELIAELETGEADDLLADANYDASVLYDLAADRGIRLIADRRRKNAGGLGHRRHSPHRIAAIELQRRWPEVLDRRRAIESCFGTQGNVTGGLGPLPNQVRRLRRVRLWVAAKLAIDAAHRKRRHRKAIA
jgi:hypothetical protein